jgi:hypothetical protein
MLRSYRTAAESEPGNAEPDFAERGAQRGGHGSATGSAVSYGSAVFGFLSNLAQAGKLPLELREQLEAEGVIFIANKVGVVRHFSGHVPGVHSAAGVSRYSGGFGFSAARIVATFPTRGDSSLRSIDSHWDTDHGPGRATITEKGLTIEIELHAVDHAFSGTMRLNYKKKLTDDVLEQLPATTLRFPVTPNFVYRAAGVRPKS